MTKKDYQLIADIINTFVASSVDNNKELSSGHAANLADSFSRRLKRCNERFNEEKFIHACLHKDTLDDETCGDYRGENE